MTYLEGTEKRIIVERYVKIQKAATEPPRPPPNHPGANDLSLYLHSGYHKTTPRTYCLPKARLFVGRFALLRGYIIINNIKQKDIPEH